MPTVTNPLHLRPPRWITPSMLPFGTELCPYSVTFEATDAKFYCCINDPSIFPEEQEANWRQGEDSTSSQYNARYTYDQFNDENHEVCFSPGSAFTAITGSDGLANEDLSVYEMFNGNFCFECIHDKFDIPTNLTLDRFSGKLSGTLGDIDDWNKLNCTDETNYKWEEVNACGCPEGFFYDETNYATCNSEALNITLPYRFTIVAFNNAGFSKRVFTLPVINNWTSDRDDFIKNIVHTNDRNTFSVDGEFVDNETYLTKMKEKGYFPTEGC